MIKSSDLVLTPEGLEKVKQELDKLKKTDRPAIIKRISEARELGDLSENADYQDAREQQSFIEGRIKELEELLKHATVVIGGKSDTVILGSKIKVQIGKETESYEIVGSNEANPLEGKISFESPVGSALMGHGAGSMIKIETPVGIQEYKIIKVE